MGKRTVGLVLVALMLVWAGWRLRPRRAVPDGGGPRGSRPATAVECAPLQRGAIRDVRTFTGSLLPRARYVSAPKTGGRLVFVALQIGDEANPEQIVARLDDEEHVQQVEQARAALDVARAGVEQQATTLALAEREMERVRLLRERGIAAEAEWDAVQAEFQAQSARLRVARAQEAERASALRAAEVRLSYTRIRPLEDPAQGVWVVEERFADEGDMLAANSPILSLVDIGSLTAVIHVIERDYPAMRAGLSVSIQTDAFPGETFTGRVVRMAPSLREASRQARVEIEVPNRPPRLRPGMFVRASIEFDRREDALLAPREALVVRDERSGVFAVDAEAGIARFVAVRTGIQSRDRVEILEPEIAGRVVTLGHHLLSDGAAVRVCPDVGDRSADAGIRP